MKKYDNRCIITKKFIEAVISMNIYDVIIIGGGPAGLTTAIYSARGGLKTLIIEKNAIGGQSLFIADVENFPGINHIDGYSFASVLLEQVKSFGTEIITDEIMSFNLIADLKSIELKNHGEVFAKNIVIATGTTNRQLGLNRETELIGKGISYCATCDGGFFRNKTVAVVGGGNTALTDAIYLSKLAKVYLIHRREEFRASKILVDRLKQTNVKVITSAVVKELKGTPLSSIIIEKGKTLQEIATNGLFVAIGTTPNTSFLNNVLSQENGYIITDENMKTSIDGVYAVGDVRKKELRQLITACADGAIASDAIIRK